MYRYLLSIAILTSSLVSRTTAEPTRGQLIDIVSQIKKADYEDDRAKLKESYDRLNHVAAEAHFASRVRYWRGFALWRRAINGFNDSVDPKDLEQDLTHACEEFKEAGASDPAFVDAKIGMISCLGYLAYLKRTDQTALQELLGQISPLVKEAITMAPNHPRLCWVLGPILSYQARESGSGKEKAIENYKKGLEFYATDYDSKDELEPSWGKPELFMSLAYAYFTSNPPDLEAAERSARDALKIVPDWHYTRDILLPQIINAKAKTK